MGAPHDAQKRISVQSLLLPLLSVILVAGYMSWQMRVAQPTAIPELSAAANALKANNVEKARQQFEKLLAQSPNLPVIYKNIMDICATFGHFDLACQYGEQAIQNCRYAPNPLRAELYETLSACYSEGHEPAPQPRATEYARRAVELAPEDPSALNSLGYTLTENVQTEAEANIALGYINSALKILRGSVDASEQMLAQTEDSYGWALCKRGKFHAEDYARAADALHQAIDDLPEDEPGATQKVMYYHLGVACRLAGRMDEARHALQVALAYDPQYADASNELKLLPPATTPPNAPAPASQNPTSAAPQTTNTTAPQNVPANAPHSASNTTSQQTQPASPPSPTPVPSSAATPTRTREGNLIFKPLNDNNPKKH